MKNTEYGIYKKCDKTLNVAYPGYEKYQTTEYEKC